MTVTVLNNGITNANIASLGTTFPAPDPTRVAVFYDEFYEIDAATGTTPATWRVLGATPVAPTVIAGAYGRIQIAPVGVADTTFLQLAGNRAAAAGALPLTWTIVQGSSGRDLWFQTSFQISNATLSTIAAGFLPAVAAAGDPLAAADGLFITKASGSTTLSLKAIKTAGSTSLLTLATLADATDIKVGFHWNAVANLVYGYVNDVRIGSIPADNLPTVGLIPLIGHGNVTAARTSQWDYAFAAQARQAAVTP